MASYLGRDLVNEAHAEDMRQTTARAVALLQQPPEEQPPATPAVDFEGLKNRLLSQWTDPAPATTPTSSVASAPSPAASTSMFDLPAHARAILSLWETPKPLNTSSVEPGPSTSGSAVSSAPSGSPRLPAGAPTASGTPSAMPTGQGPTGGAIDNSSRASFARTAYPHALQAAGGDPEFAKRLIASAISENGTVGNGGDIGVGFNFGGIKYDPQASGSGSYATWESEGGQRVNQNATFAHYNSPQEGFAAIPRFIQTNFPKQWATYQQTHDAAQLYRDINAGGYATDKGWHNSIESIAERDVAPNIGAPAQSAPARTAPAQSAASQPAANQTPLALPGTQVYQTPNTAGVRQRTTGIVVHDTGGRGATPEAELQNTLSWFQNPASQVSANAVIAADGTVYALSNPDSVAWHAGDNNSHTFGIELVQSEKDNLAHVPYTDAQYASLANLTGQLSQRYGFPINRTAIVGHQDTAQGQAAGKIDPGSHFDWDRYLKQASTAPSAPVAAAPNAAAVSPSAAAAPVAAALEQGGGTPSSQGGPPWIQAASSSTASSTDAPSTFQASTLSSPSPTATTDPILYRQPLNQPTSGTPQGGPPRQQASGTTENAVSTAALTSPPVTAREERGTPLSPLMYRQPLNQPTSGPDSVPTWQDSQTEPSGASAGVPTTPPPVSTSPQISPPPQQIPTEDPTAFPQNGQSPWASSDGSGTSSPTSPARNAPSVVPTATPTVTSQTIPNEDPTAFPRPAYVPPASPLVMAPEGQALPDTASTNSSPYDPAQAASMEPAPNRLTAPSASPLKPLYDLGGAVVGYVRDQAQQAATEIARPIVNAPSNVFDPAGPRTEADRLLQESAHAATAPLGDAVSRVATEIEQATGAPPGSLLQAAQDVSNFLGPEAAMVAGISRELGPAARAAESANPGIVQRIAQRLRAGSERAGALEAERAGQASVTTPGVFGVAPPEAGPAAEAVARPRFVPPEVRAQTGTVREIPDDPRFAQAVEAVGGTITDRGAEVYVTRAQSPQGAGRRAARGGVFVEPVPKGGRSSYAARDNPNGVGGSQELPPTLTAYRKPMVLDHPPGDAEGFNQAMQSLGIRTHPDVSRAESAMQQARDIEEGLYYQRNDMMQGWYDQHPHWTTEDADTFRASPVYQEATQRLAEANQVTDRTHAALQAAHEQYPQATADAIDAGVVAARRVGPEGSPARAQALKDIVSKYGGEPDLIDELLAIRGDSASESAWAIKENIVAGNARKAGHDGVFTIREGESPTLKTIQETPEVAQAKKVSDKAYDELRMAERELDKIRYQVKLGERPEMAAYDATSHPNPAVREARKQQIQAAMQTPEYKAARERLIAAEDAHDQALHAYNDAYDRAAATKPTISEIMDVQQSHNPTPGGWEASPRVDAARQAYVDAITRGDRAEVQRTSAALTKAENAEPPRETPPGYTLRPEYQPREPGSTTAAGSAGAVPSYAPGTGHLLDRATSALSQGVASAVSGGVGAATADQLGDPNDPNRRLKGFVAGAVAPYAIARGAGALARRAGREAGAAEGALATLGNVPPHNPQAMAQAAQQVAQNPQSPPAARRLATGIQRAARQGAPPALPNQAPGFPAPPPHAPATFNDVIQAWRYSMGLFGSVSTALLQTLGGAAEVGLGAPAEIIRQAILRGHPEHVPLIIGEALKSVPAGARSFGETAAGKVPPTIMAGSDYRPPLSDKLTGIPRAAALSVETPGRVATQAPDALWYEIYYRTGLAQAAAEEAQKAGASRLNPVASYQAQQQLLQNPTPEMIDRAHQFAQDSTYKGELGTVAKAIGTIFRGPENPTSGLGRAWREVGSYIMPVYHTIARIHEGALEYTPGIGLLPLNRLGLAAKGRPMDQKIAQQVVGLGITAYFLNDAAQGNIRGPGPSDPDELAMMVDQGYTPNSKNVGGVWVPNQDFGRAGPLLNAVGAYNDAVIYGNGKEKFADQRWDQKLALLSKNFGRAFSDYPAAQAMSSIMKLGSDPAGALAEMAGGVGSQFVPAAYRTYATATDTQQRRQDRGKDIGPGQRLVDTFESRSGVGRENLPVAQNRLGQDQPNMRQGLNVLLPRVGSDRPNPVEQAFQSAGMELGKPSDKITVGGVPIPLTHDEQRRWNTLRGDMLIQMVGPMAQNGSLERMPPAAREKVLQQMLDAAAKQADARVFAEMNSQDRSTRLRTGVDQKLKPAV